MGESPAACIPNIGPGERRKRLLFGLAMLSVTAAAALWLVAIGAPRYWRLMVAVPLFGGLLGVFQARAHTCVALAARGLRNMDRGMDAIGTGPDLVRVQAQARWVNVTTLAAGLLVLAALMTVP